MRKLLLAICIMVMACSTSFGAKVPDDVRNYINNYVPNADIRFDGVIVFPSNTVYLPLFPSLFSDVKTLSIKETYPAGRDIRQEPDVIIFNNDFVLMKVLTDGTGHRTVAHLNNPPLQVRTGLLPQDMLVPSGLIIPENIKGIIGNLKIDTKNEDVIKVENSDAYEDFVAKGSHAKSQGVIPLLKNKTVFIPTNYSKNIQVLQPGMASPSYSLAQKSIPIDVKAVNNGKFLLVTSYDRPFVDVVSVADSRFIKQISLNSNPEQILLDLPANKAYVTSPSASTIYVLDLTNMTLIQKIKINGYCEHILLTEDKLFYVDKLHNEIWAIELNKDYLLRDIGKFPNVSALAFANNKLYISSRTKSRIAVIDYDTLGLISEFTTVSKPVSMLNYKGNLYVLGAQNNEIQKINTENNNVMGTIELGTGGFSSGLKMMEGTNTAIVLDLKNNYYTLVDLDTEKVLKTYEVSVPVKDVIIADRVRLFD